MRTEEIRSQQVFANDDVAEPFQPTPTWERWRQEELWQNREGTVVRTGLYLKDRKEIADALAGLDEAVKTAGKVKSVNGEIGDVILTARGIHMSDEDSTTVAEAIAELQKPAEKNVWVEWSSIPYTNSKNTVKFTKRYAQIPSVTISVVGADPNGYAQNYAIEYLTEEVSGVTYYTGVTISIPSGLGKFINVNVIGRLK